MQFDWKLVSATTIALAVDETGPLIGVAFIGPSGSGKTSAALRAIGICPYHRSVGVADDLTEMALHSGNIISRHPSQVPNLKGSFEAKGSMILKVPVTDQIELKVCFDCSPPSSRLPEVRQWVPFKESNVSIPLYHLPPVGVLRYAVTSILTGEAV